MPNKENENLKGEDDSPSAAAGSTAQFITPDWVVIAEDPDVKAEFYTCEEAAKKRFAMMLMSYSCHLYQRVASR